MSRFFTDSPQVGERDALKQLFDAALDAVGADER